MSRRVLFYVQHLVGIGHLKRAEILAQAMARENLQVTIAFGGRAVPEVTFGGIHVAPLPPTAAANEDFSTLLDGAGRPVDDAWRERRRAALLALYRQVDPDVVVFDLFPFGRRQFRFELMPLLETIRGAVPRPSVLCSVRDILVAPRRPERIAETVETTRRHFDAVLVHGDPTLVPFGVTFPATDLISDLIHYTGYAAAPVEKAAPTLVSGEVVVSAGGGAVGVPLLDAALAARPLTPVANATWRFLTGPNLAGEAIEALRRAAGERIVVERFRTDFAALLAASLLSVSQAGYNTTLDILRSGVRAVVVPYETPGETEQRLRSEIFAARGLLTVLPSSELSPVRLAQAISTAVAKPPSSAVIDFSGAATTARLVRDFAARRKRA